MRRMSRDVRIGPERHRAVGQAQPDRPLRLHRPAQRAVVDDLVADGGDAARGFQRLAPRQHAAAGRRRDLGARDRSPRRTETACRKKNTKAGIRKCSAGAAAMKPRHQRDQDQLARFGPRHQPAQIVGRVGDVGVGEPEIFRRKTRRPGRSPAASPRACRSSPAAAALPSARSGGRLQRPRRQLGGAVIAD